MSPDDERFGPRWTARRLMRRSDSVLYLCPLCGSPAGHHHSPACKAGLRLCSGCGGEFRFDPVVGVEWQEISWQSLCNHCLTYGMGRDD